MRPCGPRPKSLVRRSSPRTEAGLAGARAAALGWALIIGWARLHLGVHSLPDVLAGWALGLVLWRRYDSLLASGAESAMCTAWWQCALHVHGHVHWPLACAPHPGPRPHPANLAQSCAHYCCRLPPSPARCTR